MIAEYVERLGRELDFDPSLSRRVRREVEDHLWEAVAADPAGGGLEAERRAVARFGDPRVIANQFAVVSLGKRSRRVGLITLLVIATVLIAMKARLAWYAVTARPPDRMGVLGDVVLAIDRHAFWLAVLVGTAGWIYIASRRRPSAMTAEYRTQLRRFALLGLVATGGVIASVIGDGVLTSLRLMGAGWSLDLLIPLVSMAIEVGCAAGLVVAIRGLTRRAASPDRAGRPG